MFDKHFFSYRSALNAVMIKSKSLLQLPAAVIMIIILIVNIIIIISNEYVFLFK